LIAYAGRYGGPPSHALPWPLFYVLARGAAQLDARDQLRIMLGTAWGAQHVMADQETLDGLQQAADGLQQLAYPMVTDGER
jgi:hypothetical protein